VLTDLIMPEQDGLETIEILRWQGAEVFPLRALLIRRTGQP
jgi:CheY-like chemotaxis protein